MKKKILSFTLAAFMVLGLVGFGNVKTVRADEKIPVYRLYNEATGEHFYTMGKTEYEYLQTVGWVDEGVGWYAAGAGDPVYRLYNPNVDGGDHYYTMSKTEAEYLESIGWSVDNNWEPAFYSGGETPLYVAYNPNAASGAHNYTTNVTEQEFLLNNGWTFGEVAWQVVAPGEGKVKEYDARVEVDCNETTVGGGEGVNPGSYRWLYSNKVFDSADLSAEVPEVDFSADVVLTGHDGDYAVQFVIAGSEAASGQVGLTLHYQDGYDKRYGQGEINVTSINFPAGAGSHGEQYYSVNTSAPKIANGQKVRLQVKYFASGYMQTFVDGTLVGQYKTKMNPDKTSTLDILGWDPSTQVNRYALHFNADDSCVVSNVKVYRRGLDYTTWGGNDPYGFNQSSYDISNTTATANIPTGIF